MLYKDATLKQIVNTLTNSGDNLPVIVNAQSSNDYKNIYDKLIRVGNCINVSSLFTEEKSPNQEDIRAIIKGASENSVILGLTSVYGFLFGKKDCAEILATIMRGNKKLIVLTYGVRSIIEEKLRCDVRLEAQAHIFLIGNAADIQSEIRLTNFHINQHGNFKSLKDFFIETEKNGGCVGRVVSNISDRAFSKDIWNVRKQDSAFSMLIDLDARFASLDERCGTEQQWGVLLNELKDRKFSELMYSSYAFDLSSAIKKFKEAKESTKWYTFLWLKTESLNGYLKLMNANVKNVDDILPALYNTILDIEPSNKVFWECYEQRKELLKTNGDVKRIYEFINLSQSKGKSRVKYLTDSTEIERKEIIKCFTQFAFTRKEIIEIAQKVYPLLGEYFSSFTFCNEAFDNYFETYKYQKVRNIILPEFKEVVEANARLRPYNCLPALTKIISQISSDNSKTYWVDALGAEYCGLINAICKRHGLSAKVQIARAELPTLTGFNQDFSPLTIEKDGVIKDLDKLKHSGSDEYDFTKSSLPLYIEEELRIIEKIIRKAEYDLSKNKKVIIVSDHGASRLIRIAENILTIPVDTNEKDEKHGGRCCVWNPAIPAQFQTVTDSENNGFCVIANYDRFKGGKYTGVELHGGATLEEVVVPIIEITHKVATYDYRLSKKELIMRGRNTEPLVIVLSREIDKPRIRINGQGVYLSAIEKSGSTYTFETNITKSGQYTCILYDNNEEIITCINFEVKSALGGIKNLF